MNRLGLVDWVVLAVYFAAVFSIALWITRRERLRVTSAGNPPLIWVAFRA